MSLRFAWEKLRDLLREPNLKELLEQHFLEVAEDQSEIPLEVSWPHYLGLEDRNILRISTARKDRQLVGFCCYFVDRHPNYPVLYAWDGAFYLRPDCREGLAGYKLLKWAEPELRLMGVRRVVRHEKLGSSLGPLYARLGYRPYEMKHTKVL